jgi:transposase
MSKKTSQTEATRAPRVTRVTRVTRATRATADAPAAAPASPATPRPAPAPKRPSTGRRRPAPKQAKGGGALPPAEWQVIHPHAAGIDIGSREHWVSVGAHRPGENKRAFGAYTPDLAQMVAWLRGHGITHVAMESTGLYWLPVYEALEEAGFAVILADARQTRHTAWRKSDLADCEWIAQLLAYGLLRAAFRPTDELCRLRTLLRHRKTLVAASARSVLHMQKALDGMNLHVHHALSHLAGVSGLAMIDAIVAGEHDPQRLAALADRRVKKSPAELGAALTGNYRAEELFVLGQARTSHRHFEEQIARCDRQIDAQMEALAAACPPRPEPAAEPAASGSPAPGAAGQPPAAATRHTRERQGQTRLTGLLHRLFGVDLTQLPGLAALAVLTLLGEIGTDMSRWRNAKAFASWLGLCPNHRISGGRLLSAQTRKVVNRAATVLRLAALAAGKTDTPLGCFYRRKAAQFGAPKAITATARKMACLVYEMIRTGREYRAIATTTYQKQFDQQRLKSFRRRAHELGYDLVELPKAA